MQGHVRTGTCPLCGEDHGSKDELLRRIQDHVAADAASGARADLARVQEKSKQLAERVADSKEKRKGRRESDRSEDRASPNFAAEIGKFADAVGKLGIVVEVWAEPDATTPSRHE